jgi:integrase
MSNSPIDGGPLVAGESDLWALFGLELERVQVPAHHRPHFRRWVEIWLQSFPTSREGLEVQDFAKRLESEGKPEWQCRQAYQALKIWVRLDPSTIVAKPEKEADTGAENWATVLKRMESNLRAKRYSPHTVKVYIDWSKRLARGKESPPRDSRQASSMVQGFLEHLALVENLAPATIAQAPNALAWLVRKELGFDLELLEKGGAHQSKRLPSVIAPDAVRSILDCCPAPWDLFFGLQYGCGFRLAELLDLRIQDIELERGVVVVRSGKGDKDRILPLPKSLRLRLDRHLEQRRLLWIDDLKEGLTKVDLPFGLGRKWPGAETSWEWQHVFGSTRPLQYPGSIEMRRWRPLEKMVRKALRDAAVAAGIPGRIHPHLLRHCYATHLVELGVPLSEIQELMGHARLETTMIYLHVRSPIETRISPLDR